MSEDKLFENPRLTLSEVADALGTTPKTVSDIINSGFNMNFNDFINHYRIESVKERLKNGNTSDILMTKNDNNGNEQ